MTILCLTLCYRVYTLILVYCGYSMRDQFLSPAASPTLQSQGGTDHVPMVSHGGCHSVCSSNRMWRRPGASPQTISPTVVVDGPTIATRTVSPFSSTPQSGGGTHAAPTRLHTSSPTLRLNFRSGHQRRRLHPNLMLHERLQLSRQHQPRSLPILMLPPWPSQTLLRFHPTYPRPHA